MELIEKIISLAKRRGIIFPSSEIYGSFAGFFDYGNYGSMMKRNIENSWLKHFVTSREDVVLIDGSTITHPNVWKASGHLKSFNDPLVECKKCHKRFRADHLVESKLNISIDGLSGKQIQDTIIKHKIVCPECKGEFTLIKLFNLMFKTHVGAVEDYTSAAYLRPETAQIIFTDFKQILTTSRKKLPFGIAQIGRAFRNEISPRNFVFRTREFNMMEMEYFIHPKKINDCLFLDKEFLDYEIGVLTEEMQNNDKSHEKMGIKGLIENKVIKTQWHAYWIVESLKWLENIGIKKENLRIRQHTKNELSHYSIETWDIEYNYPWGWKELAGIANRTDFDLKQQIKLSKADLTYFDEETKEKVVPFVIEPSFGIERIVLTLLLDGYSEKTGKDETKVVLKLKNDIAPINVAVFPLMKKDELVEKAREVFNTLKQHYLCDYDDSGSIGKRYARMDELGVPWCITIDYDSLKDNSVTIRDRNTTKQIRIKIVDITNTIKDLIEGKNIFNLNL